MSKYLLIIGSNSDIAKACAREFAKNGFNLILLARDFNKANEFARDLKIRSGVNVEVYEFDLNNYKDWKKVYEQFKDKVDGVLLAAGFMADQKECEKDENKTLQTIIVNYLSPVLILNDIANDFQNKKKQGFIIGISSVAGDRGRKSNYIYGSSKAGLTAYLSGLRGRLEAFGGKVITVKPGFVRTKMTERLPLPKALVAEPEETARDIYKAYVKGKDVVYTKWFWKWIMLIIKAMPEKIFKKINF